MHVYRKRFGNHAWSNNRSNVLGERLQTAQYIRQFLGGSSHGSKRRSRPFWGVLHMEQKGVADHFGGSSHEIKRRSRPFWGILHMGQNADHFGGFFTWDKRPTIFGGSSHGLKCRPFWWFFARVCRVLGKLLKLWVPGATNMTDAF